MPDIYIDIIIQLFDFTVLYYICHNIISEKVHVNFKSLFIFIAYGSILGVASYYLNDYTYKILVTIAILCLIRYITKKRVHDILIIYMINFSLIASLQIIVMLVVKSVPLNHTYLVLFVQTVTSVAALLLNWKLPLNKLFRLVEKELLLKLFFYLVTSILLITTAYLNFDYKNTELYLAYFLILVLVSLLGLYRTIKYIFFYTNKMPVQLHDVKNVLMGLYISTESSSNIERIRLEMRQALSIMGMDSITETHIATDVNNENILAFIHQKKQKGGDGVIIVPDIHYDEDNHRISLSVILYMLGVLLDNAIESGTKKEIYTNVEVSEEYVLISVANEYERKGSDDFSKMFESRYSTKSSPASGFGLSHLSQITNSYGGEIGLEHKYYEKQKCHYLIITIGFGYKT